MNLLTLGVNHETAPVNIREIVLFTAERTQEALMELKTLSLVSECIILSTCNRTEIYCILKANNTAKQLQEWLRNFFGLEQDILSQFLYMYHGLDAVKHIMCVSSGLNSLVLGEPQIFGQIKEAYNIAHKADSIHQTLESLFQHIFRTVKQVRTDTSIGLSSVSVAFSAVSLSKQFFGNLEEQRALLIGAGETIELVSRHLKEANISQMTIANRTYEKAHTLAEKVGGYAIQLDEIDKHLHEADIIIASTGSPTTVLKQPQAIQALKMRKNKPMFMIDIAVPRDIDPSINQLENIYLYTIDDLQEIIESNKQSRQSAALEAEKIIEFQANAFITRANTIQQVKPVIRQYRKQAMHLKEEALNHALHQLEQGVNPKEIIERLANQLTNKLIHTPTARLNHAGLKGNIALIEHAEALLICNLTTALPH